MELNRAWRIRLPCLRWSFPENLNASSSTSSRRRISRAFEPAGARGKCVELQQPAQPNALYRGASAFSTSLLTTNQKPRFGSPARPGRPRNSNKLAGMPTPRALASPAGLVASQKPCRRQRADAAARIAWCGRAQLVDCTQICVTGDCSAPTGALRRGPKCQLAGARDQIVIELRRRFRMSCGCGI